MWTIGIVSTISQFVKPPPYLFSDTATALIFLAPMAGTILAEFWGHWFNDFVANRYIKSHNGKFKPEIRLVGVFIPWIIGIGGLVLFGQTLQHSLPWVALAFGWGMNCFSTLGSATAVSAYFLDVMPQHAALSSAWLNAFRTVGKSLMFEILFNEIKWLKFDAQVDSLLFTSKLNGLLAAVLLSLSVARLPLLLSSFSLSLSQWSRAPAGVRDSLLHLPAALLKG